MVWSHHIKETRAFDLNCFKRENKQVVMVKYKVTFQFRTKFMGRKRKNLGAALSVYARRRAKSVALWRTYTGRFLSCGRLLKKLDSQLNKIENDLKKT